MDRVDIASKSEKPAALEYLESRGLVENAWVMWPVSDTLDAGDSAAGRVLVCGRGGELAGVAHVMMVDDKWTKKPAYDYQVEYDAEDENAAALILQACPAASTGEFLPSRSELQAYFAALPGVAVRPSDLYHTVTPADFMPVPPGEVSELTEADAALFEGSGQPPNWENVNPESRLFAVVRDGRAACSLKLTQIGPVAPSGRRAMAVGALYTEEPFRRQGLCKQLVSYATEMVLRAGDAPMYWTAPENVASQALCQGLGYKQYWQRTKYLWRRDS